MHCSKIVVALGLCLLAQPSAAQIQWEVDNRFRVITGQAEQKRFERNLDRYVACAKLPLNAKTPPTCLSTRLHRASPMNQVAKYLAEPAWIGPKGYNYQTYWLPIEGRYNREELRKKQRTIIVSLANANRGRKCNWFVNGKKEITNGSCQSETISNLEIDREYVVEGRVLESGVERFSPADTAKIFIRDLVIVALGDSFISGEGNPHSLIWSKPDNYLIPNGLPSYWWDRRCHRSLLAGPAQAALKLAKEQKHYSITYLSYACSGATTADGILGKYIGLEAPAELRYWYPYGVEDAEPQTKTLISQIDAVTRDLCLNCDVAERGKIDVLVVSTGGNDIGFGAIVSTMLMGCGSVADCRNKAITAIRNSKIKVGPNGIPGLLNGLTKDLNEELAPAITALKARHVLVPEYIDPTRRGANEFCDDAVLRGLPQYYERQSLFPLAGALGYGVTKYGSMFAHREVISPLNATIKGVAKQNGWTFVEGIMSPRAGLKGYCSLSSWFLVYPQSLEIQGISTTVEAPSGTMHPNIFGHINIGESLLMHYRKALPAGAKQQ